MLLLLLFVSGSEPFILFANRHDVREIKVRSGHYRPIIEGLRSVRAIDYNIRDNVLYWSDAANILRSVHLSLYLSVCLSVCLSICLFLCLSV